MNPFQWNFLENKNLAHVAKHDICITRTFIGKRQFVFIFALNYIVLDKTRGIQQCTSDETFTEFNSLDPVQTTQ